MRIVKTVREMQKLALEWRQKNLYIGFVPTMGALHDGHGSLVRRARKENDIVVASIFVNPTQFGPKEDFKKYPRTLKRDQVLLAKEHVDVLFIPSIYEMYPSKPAIVLDMPSLTHTLCGVSRPTHFQGVLLVVAKLFSIVKPHNAYFGQKDFQQSVIIRKMAQNLNFPVQMKVCPIVREKNGLAMSSRNAYLNECERKNAVCLWHALSTAKKLFKEHRSTASIMHAMRIVIAGYPLARIDYISIRDAETLEEIKRIEKGRKIVVALAVFIGKTRLIDNIFLHV